MGRGKNSSEMPNNPEETRNFLIFLAVFIDIATETVLKVFYHEVPKHTFHSFVSTGNIDGILKKTLSKRQYYLVKFNTADPDRFDFSILFTLLRIALTPPSAGWNQKPAQTDVSVAADILRLRYLRNNIVAHRHKATLSTYDFNRYFGELEAVIFRLSGSEEQQDVAKKIESYKKVRLDYSKEEFYLNKLQEWHDDLQQKVQELLSETEKFHMFFEGKQDKYVQYLMLLVDAGRLVFIAYLQNLLATQEESLAKLLLDKRELLQENLTSQEMKTLCLDENPNTDMESWDMSVLGSVILVVFGSSIERKKRDAIKCIKKAWKNYASTAIEVVDRERFLHCEEHLVSALRSLSGSDEYEKIEELIKRYRSPMEDVGDNVSYFEKLERHGVKMARIEDEYKEYIRSLKEAISVMDDVGIFFIEKHDFALKLHSVCEDREKQKQAEGSLSNLSEAALKYTDRKLDSKELKFESLHKSHPGNYQPQKDEGVVLSPQSSSSEAYDDPRTRKLFEDAIKDGEEIDKTIRVMIIGCYNQGKTTLAMRLQGQSIEGIESTNGIDIHKCANTANGIWQKQNTENDEDEKIKRIAKVMISNSKSEDDVIGDVDYGEYEDISTQPVGVTANESLSTQPVGVTANESQAQSLNVFRSDKSETADAIKPSVILQDRKIHQQKERHEQSGDPLPLQKVLRAMEKNENVEETIHMWDFGGQFVFYATHQLFHSKHAVYLLVFDLSKSLDHLVKDNEYPDGATSATKSMKEYIEFWVNSVHSFVASKDSKQPQIVLVGTHTDKLQDAKEEAHEYFEAIRQLFDGSTLRMHLHPKTFAISGLDPSDKAIQSLRKTIFDIGRANNQAIPARWIPLEMALSEVRDENIIQFKRLQEIDRTSKYPINKEEQLKFFLEFHHTKGTYLFYDDSKLAQFVVLNPQYIVDAFKCIITSREFCITDGTLRPLWQQLTKDAILRPELIQGLWDNGTENRFSKFKDVLVLFLQKLRIIAEAQTFDTESESLVPLGYYIVPSFLRKADNDEIVTFLKGLTCTTVSIVYVFENEAIVPTIFQRVMASAIGTWPVIKISSERSLLFENTCAFKLDLSYAGIILRHRKRIELSMAQLCEREKVFGDKPDYFRRFVEYVIGSEFGKLQKNGDDLGKYLFRTGIKCFHETHEYAGSKEIYYLDDLKPLSAKLVSCPDDNVHHEGICIEQIFQQWFFREKETLSTKKKIPQRKLSEKEYVKLSCECIGREWKFLARQLKISQVRIDHIEMDNQKTKGRIFEMLLEWDKKDRDRATLDVLVQALEDISSPAVKSDTLKNIIDSFYCQ